MPMRIVQILEKSVPLSRYANEFVPADHLDTSMVAVRIETDGPAVIGFGFGSIGRYAQGGLIRERFAPRLLAAAACDLVDELGVLDPLKAWHCMMNSEKPGGHGERCVAVGALDMALWDAAAKLQGLPLWRLLATRFGVGGSCPPIAVYVGGGYYYPRDDIELLVGEIDEALGQGYSDFKIKVGGASLATDVRRIEAVLSLVGEGRHLALDAMNRYDAKTALDAAQAFQQYGVKWFEDVCDPLDYATHACVARAYPPPIAAGEALFSESDAVNLLRYGGLRADRDILLFDPAHCYGLPGYLRILEAAHAYGWSRERFWPHGGHLFGLHVACGLGLGGAEANPYNFQPFGGFYDGVQLQAGRVLPPEVPGIGWETRSSLRDLFATLGA